MATPSSSNMYLGSGEIFFNRFDANGALTQWRSLGMCTKFELNPTVQVAEKYSSLTGARGLYARAVTQTGAEAAITMHEFDKENLALAFLGTANAFAQSSGTATDTSLGTGNVKLGYALDTGKKKITVTGVKKSPSTALVSDVDFSYDSDSGLIRFLSTATAITDGDTALWTGSYPTIASFDVAALTNAILNGRLKYVSATDSTGPRYEVEVFKASISPDGALGFIGDDFAEIGLKVAALQDTTQTAGNQFFHARLL